jgi:hypothetical protein
MTKKKKLETVPPPHELILQGLRAFCEDFLSSYPLVHDPLMRNLEVMIAGLDEGYDAEDCLSLAASFFSEPIVDELLQESGLTVDLFFIRLAGRVDALPAKSVTQSHLSILEVTLGIRQDILKEGSERPESVAFALGRLVADRLRPGLMYFVGTAPDYPTAINRALSFLYLSVSGFSGGAEVQLQEWIKGVPSDQGFLRKIYGDLFDRLRKESIWRDEVANTLSAFLPEDQLQQIRTGVFSWPDEKDMPSQAFLIYRTLVLFWIPQALFSSVFGRLNSASSTDDILQVLADYKLENPEPERPLA